MRLLLATLLLRFEVQFGPQKSDQMFFNPTMQRKDGYFGTLTLHHGAE